MRVTKYLVKVKVEKDKYIYINTLNGAVDIIDSDTNKKIDEMNLKEYSIKSEQEAKIYQYLLGRGYLLTEKDEEKIRTEILYKNRNRHNRCKDNYKNVCFVITYNCNFRCPYCYEKYLKLKGKEWMNAKITTEMIDMVFENFGNNIENVHLFGGEPLLLENIDIIKYILDKKKNISFSVTTNGYTLEEYVPLLSKYDFNMVEVTLDGLENSHNKRRFLENGRGTYSKINKGLEMALKNKMPIRIRINVDKDNYDEAKLLCKELSSQFSQYSDLMNISINPILGKDENSKLDLLYRIFKDDNKDAIKLDKYLETYHPIVKLFKGTGKWIPKYEFCNANKGQVFFDPHGYIYTCPTALGTEQLSCGRYFPKLEDISKSQWTNRTIETIDSCKKCKFALICGGGCTTEAYYKNGSILSGVCSQNEFLLNKIIPLLYDKFIRNSN